MTASTNRTNESRNLLEAKLTMHGFTVTRESATSWKIASSDGVAEATVHSFKDGRMAYFTVTNIEDAAKRDRRDNPYFDRAVKAATSFIVRRDYELVETVYDSPFDIVARDEEDLVFIRVSVTDGEGFAGDMFEYRSECEVAANKWLASHNLEGDQPIRFDHIEMIVCGEERALLRHHINALGSM